MSLGLLLTTGLVLSASYFFSRALHHRLAEAVRRDGEKIRAEREARARDVAEEKTAAAAEAEAARARAREITDRYEVVRKIGSSLDFAETLQHIQEGARRLLDAPCGIYLSPGREGLPSGHFFPPDWPDAPMAPETARNDPFWEKALSGERVTLHEGKKKRLWIPLRAGEIVFGVLHVVTDAPGEAIRIFLTQSMLALEKIRLYARLERESQTDLLTGLPHRRRFDALFDDEVRRAAGSGRTFTLLLADIDRFKSVNDNHGHLVGDAVLASVARALRDAARDVDLVARYGGEEFSILLPETPRSKGAEVADRFRRQIEAMPVASQVAGRERILKVTLSMGVAGFPEDGVSTADLLARVDEALYEAKRSGRNRVVVAGTRS